MIFKSTNIFIYFIYSFSSSDDRAVATTAAIVTLLRTRACVRNASFSKSDAISKSSLFLGQFFSVCDSGQTNSNPDVIFRGTIRVFWREIKKEKYYFGFRGGFSAEESVWAENGLIKEELSRKKNKINRRTFFCFCFFLLSSNQL